MTRYDEDDKHSFIRVNGNVNNLNRLINILVPARYGESKKDVTFSFKSLDQVFTEHDIKIIGKLFPVTKYDATMKNITLNFLEKSSKLSLYQAAHEKSIESEDNLDEDFNDRNKNIIFDMVDTILKTHDLEYFFRKPIKR